MFNEVDIQILSILLNTNDIITSETLSFETLLSVKTIRKRIKDLNEILVNHGARINMKQGTGINLEIIDDSLFHKFRREHMENPNLVQNQNNITSELIDILVSQPDYVKAEYLTEALFISKTKLTQSLKDVRTILSYYDLSLESKPYYGLKIVGSEFNFRRFLASNYVQKFRFPENETLIPMEEEAPSGYTSVAIWPNNKENKQIHQKLRKGIREIVEEQLQKQQYSMPQNLVDNLIDHLFITVIRIRKGMYIDTESNIIYPEENQDEYQDEYRLAEKILAKIEEDYDIRFSEKEYGYIMLHLIGKRVLEVSDSQQVPSEVNVLVDKILVKIKEAKNIDLRNDLDLRTMLALHIVPLITRIYNGIELKNPIIEDVKIRCIAGYDLAFIGSEVINQYFHTRISEHEISYFALHFDVALNRGEEAIRKKKILVVCSTGRASAELLRYKFEQNFSRYLKEITVCDAADVNLYLSKQEYDYIFTAIPLRQQTSIPVFEFNFFLNNETINKIENVLTGKLKYKEIVKYFPRELFFSNINVNTREEALSYLFREIRKVKQLPENFESLVWERERFFGTDILNNTAFPHPNKLVTEDTFIAVMVLKKPILWEKNKVRIVFLNSISRTDSDKYKFIFEWLIDLLSSKTAVQKMVTEGTYEAMIQELLMLDEAKKE